METELPVTYYATARLVGSQVHGDIVVSSKKQHAAYKHRVEDDIDSNMRFQKTRLCLFNQRGACVKGEGCSYAHCAMELKSAPNLLKTRLCQDWLNGRCVAGDCKFAHGRQELRFTHDYYKTRLCHFWQQGGCTKGDQCRHAHGPAELRPMPCEGIANAVPCAPIINVETCRDSVDHTTTDNTSVVSNVQFEESEAETEDLSEDDLVPKPDRFKDLGTMSNYDKAMVVDEALQLADAARQLALYSSDLLQGVNGKTHRPRHSLRDPRPALDTLKRLNPPTPKSADFARRLEPHSMYAAPAPRSDVDIDDIDALATALNRLIVSGGQKQSA